MSVHYFCVAGNHAGPKSHDGNDLNQFHGIPQSWRYVPATFNKERQQWQYMANSGCSILVCPECFVDGEPALN